MENKTKNEDFFTLITNVVVLSIAFILGGIVFYCLFSSNNFESTKTDLSNSNEVKIEKIEVLADSLKTISRLRNESKLHLYPEKFIDEKTLSRIDDFRPFVKDIVISYYAYPDDLELTLYQLKGRRFGIWIANGYDNLALYTPIQLEFTSQEKRYLWGLYRTYQLNFSQTIRLLPVQ